MINTNEIHRIMSEEFMGHKVDGVIISPPMKLSPFGELVEKIWQEYAVNKLEQEAKYVLDLP